MHLGPVTWVYFLVNIASGSCVLGVLFGKFDRSLGPLSDLGFHMAGAFFTFYLGVFCPRKISSTAS